jgi:hypothetical protein
MVRDGAGGQFLGAGLWSKRRMRLIVLLLMGCLGWTSQAWAVNVGLEWEYATEEPGAEADGFNLYRGDGDPVCDDPALLTNKIGATNRQTLLFVNQLPVETTTGTICYEATAFNPVGESSHSNRATVQVQELIPVQPTGLTVGVIIE